MSAAGDGKKIAVVTGANKGIGLETCRQLARLGYRVILTARDPSRGKRAVEDLRREGMEVTFHPLDVTETNQIGDLAAFIRKEYGRLDVLVNNAAVQLDSGTPEEAGVLVVDPETVRGTLETNLYGPLRMCQALVPLMAGRGRVVNVSSGMGQLAEMGGGWPAYRISKTALNALTGILAAELRNTRIKVNSVCPGWVRTDMGGPNAERPVEKGAETIVWLATLPEDGPTGGFFRDKRPIPW